MPKNEKFKWYILGDFQTMCIGRDVPIRWGEIFLTFLFKIVVFLPRCQSVSQNHFRRLTHYRKLLLLKLKNLDIFSDEGIACASKLSLKAWKCRDTQFCNAHTRIQLMPFITKITSWASNWEKIKKSFFFLLQSWASNPNFPIFRAYQIMKYNLDSKGSHKPL